MSDFLLVSCAALCIQICCNWFNDYYDNLRGTDDKTMRLGPIRALQQKSLSSREFLIAIAFLCLIVMAISCYYFFVYGWTFSTILMLSLFMAYFYTGSKYSLAYHGLGDLMAFIFFGPVIVLSSAAIFSQEMWHIDDRLAMFSLFCGIFSLKLIIVNNYRDRESDLAHKKNTSAVLFGDNFCKITYASGVFLLIAIPFLLGHWEQKIIILLPLATAPFLLTNTFFLFIRNKKNMNILLKRTGITYFFYTMLMAIAIICSK